MGMEMELQDREHQEVEEDVRGKDQLTGRGDTVLFAHP